MAAQGIIRVTPVDLISGSETDTNWETFDITAYVGADAGDVVGCIIEVWKTAGTPFGMRHGASVSTTKFIKDFEQDWRQFAVGVDTTDDTFDMVFDAWANVKIYLVGYVVSEAGHFLTDYVDWSPTTINSWSNDHDVQTDYGDGQGDTVAAVLMNWESSQGAARDVGVRPKGGTGKTYSTSSSAGPHGLLGAGVGVGADAGIVQTYSSDISGAKPYGYFVGYINDGYIETIDPPTDYSTATTGSYQDVTVSEVTEASDGALGVIYESAMLSGWVRKKGETLDLYGVGLADFRSFTGFFVGVDGSGVFEQQIESTAVDVDVWGWVKQGGAAGGVTVPALDEGMLVGGFMPLAGGLA